jgi:hypothetical protein
MLWKNVSDRIVHKNVVMWTVIILIHLQMVTLQFYLFSFNNDKMYILFNL